MQVLARGAQNVPFVEPGICQTRYPQQYRDWIGSHHEQAMQVAHTDTVLGDFSGVSFTHQGKTSGFFKRDGKFFVHTDGPDGCMSDFEIQYTFGVEPLQQYLIPLPVGRLQSLSIAWDTKAKRWFHL